MGKTCTTRGRTNARYHIRDQNSNYGKSNEILRVRAESRPFCFRSALCIENENEKKFPNNCQKDIDTRAHRMVCMPRRGLHQCIPATEHHKKNRIIFFLFLVFQSLFFDIINGQNINYY